MLFNKCDSFYLYAAMQRQGLGECRTVHCRDDHIQDQRTNLNVHKSIGPEETLLKVLRELSDEVSKNTVHHIKKL